MAILQGTVTQVRKLDPRNDDDSPMSAISIEGFNVLVGDGKSVPNEGDCIRANVSVKWRKGKPPIHFLDAWNSVLGQLA